MSTLAATIGRGTNGARPAAAEAGRLYYDTTNSQLQRDNGSSWDSVGETSAGNVAADAIWDAAGDLAQGTGANTAAKLSAGLAGQVLKSAGAAAANLWAYPPGYEFGYAEITADITTTSDTAVDATGLSVTFTAAGETVIVEYFCSEVYNSVVGKRTSLQLQDTTGAADIQLVLTSAIVASQGTGVFMRRKVTATTGSQQYKVQWKRVDAAGTSTMRCSSTARAYIRVTKA